MSSPVENNYVGSDSWKRQAKS